MSKKLNIFCDGVFDLFHYGHVNHFKKIKEKFKNCNLIVGVLDDPQSSNYKRKPYYNHNKRLALIKSCKYVDNILINYPLIITNDFLIENNIHYVVHGFINNDDYKNQYKFYKLAIKLNKFITIKYDYSISTSKILENINKTNFDLNLDLDNTNNTNNIQKKDWDLIWELKGNNINNDPFILNGYENTNFDYNKVVNIIKTQFKLKIDDKLLEIGCGAGLLSSLLNNKCDYYGIDYSFNLLCKNIKLFNTKVFNCEANNTPFKDKYFDYVFSVGVFEYFKDKNYAQQVINEMTRITKKGIFILNIRKSTHKYKKAKHKFSGTYKHLVYNENDSLFKDFIIMPSSYECEERFSVYKKLI